MLISFQCQTLPAFGHQLRQQQQLSKELNPFSVYVMQEQNKNADKLRRVTNKQTQRQPQEPQSQSQWHSCNVSAADTVSQRYAYAALGHCVKLDSPPAVHLLLVPYIYQHTCVCICVCVCVWAVYYFSIIISCHKYWQSLDNLQLSLRVIPLLLSHKM